MGYRPLSMRVRFLSFGFVSSESWAGSARGLVGAPGRAPDTPLFLREPGLGWGVWGFWTTPPTNQPPTTAQHSHDARPSATRHWGIGGPRTLPRSRGGWRKNTKISVSRGLLSSMSGLFLVFPLSLSHSPQQRRMPAAPTCHWTLPLPITATHDDDGAVFLLDKTSNAHAVTPHHPCCWAHTSLICMML